MAIPKQNNMARAYSTVVVLVDYLLYVILKGNGIRKPEYGIRKEHNFKYKDILLLSILTSIHCTQCLTEQKDLSLVTSYSSITPSALLK